MHQCTIIDGINYGPLVVAEYLDSKAKTTAFPPPLICQT
jgi:hypothetical protein